MNNNQMQDIHTPYHFVPLSQWVYMPDWAHLVSHDHPFEEGYSGVIDYTLTNATPLCVGAEHAHAAGSASLVKWARDPSGKPVIPGSSIKGMLRSVLEIVSFAKLSAVDDAQFSYREVASNSSYLSFIGRHQVKAGWIKFNESSECWEFTPCLHAKIKHADIKNSLGKLVKNDDSAIEKYNKYPLNKEITSDISEPKGTQKNRWAENIKQGSVIGNLIFTNKRIIGMGNNQDYEFSYYFYNTEDKPKFRNIDKNVHDLFTNHLEDQVKYLKEHPHQSKGIPVFALLNKAGNTLHSLGLAKMPRVSYKYSIGDLVKEQHKAHQADSYFDLAELMFGTLRDNGFSLKSRIAFTDATSNETTKNSLFESNSLILNGAKPTFYPAYLEQNPKILANKKFNDYDDKTAPAGRKRYVSKEPEFDKLTQFDLVDKDNVASRMELAAIGSEFSGKLVFHNLKTEELGALIWVLKLGANNKSYHSLGHGKPYGAGSVKISPKISQLKGNKKCTELPSADDFMQKFIEQMDNNYPFDNQWSDSPQLKYLHALADMQGNFDIDTRYMSIDNKDYQRVKNNGTILEPFNNITRTDSNYEKDCVSPSFGKGRLSALLDQNSSWDNDQINRQSISIEKMKGRLTKINEMKQKTVLKNQLANEKEKLRGADDLSPYDKNKSLLSLLIQDQNSLSKTDQKKKVKELREIFKEIKVINLTVQEAGILIELYSQISLSKKESDKAINYLRKII